MRYPAQIAATVAGLLLVGPGMLSAQADTLRLGLRDAIALARTGHPAVAQAAADRRAREADVLASSAAFAPRIGVELAAVRSTDPVAVFGGRLRQGRFAEADFALPSLNHPAALTDVSTALTVEQPLFQPQALMLRRAGQDALQASRLGESRIGQAATFDIVRAYFGNRMADERVTVLQEALEVTRRILTQVQSLRRNGSVTMVDEQLARARTSELEAGLAAAESARLAAGDLLLLLLGQPTGRPLLLTDSLAVSRGADTSTVISRDDVAALEAAVAAADANVSRARAGWLPSAAAFGTLDWHAGSVGIARGPGHWTAGLVLRWSPFQGMADFGQLRRAEAERDGARARLADQRRRVDAEIRLARAERVAAEVSIAASEAALAGASQAVRVAQVRYTEGVATITELLAVRSAESSQLLARLLARYQLRIADAALAFALGRVPE